MTEQNITISTIGDSSWNNRWKDCQNNSPLLLTTRDPKSLLIELGQRKNIIVECVYSGLCNTSIETRTPNTNNFIEGFQQIRQNYKTILHISPITTNIRALSNIISIIKELSVSTPLIIKLSFQQRSELVKWRYISHQLKQPTIPNIRDRLNFITKLTSIPNITIVNRIDYSMTTSCSTWLSEIDKRIFNTDKLIELPHPITPCPYHCLHCISNWENRKLGVEEVVVRAAFKLPIKYKRK